MYIYIHMLFFFFYKNYFYKVESTKVEINLLVDFKNKIYIYTEL